MKIVDNIHDIDLNYIIKFINNKTGRNFQDIDICSVYKDNNNYYLKIGESSFLMECPLITNLLKKNEIDSILLEKNQKTLDISNNINRMKTIVNDIRVFFKENLYSLELKVYYILKKVIENKKLRIYRIKKYLEQYKKYRNIIDLYNLNNNSIGNDIVILLYNLFQNINKELNTNNFDDFKKSLQEIKLNNLIPNYGEIITEKDFNYFTNQ